MADKNRRESKEKQEHTKGRNGPLYTLDSVSNGDWKLFMWFASLRTIENCIHLFIVVWNAIPVRGKADLTREFNEETDEMIRIVGEINVSKLNITSYSKILDNYRNYRHSGSKQDQEARDGLVEGVWMKLESCGLKDYSYAVEGQLKRCTVHQKQALRKMILSRMKSFRSFARLIQESMKDNQIKEAKKDNHSGKKLKDEKFNSQKAAPDNKSKDDNQVKLLLEENENLVNEKKLISDIEELQDMLDDFTMVQGSDYKIKDQNAASLLETYKCQPKYPSTKTNFVLGTVLQHHAIITILEDAQKYLQYARSSGVIDPTLESDIVDTTENLIRYTELFRDKRGKDDITKITPIKIRQHTYSALSSRGLSTQAFEPDYRFFQAGDDVDARLMRGAFGGQEVKNLEVEACGFPCIAIFGSDNSNSRVFTKAQVIARPKKAINT